MEVLKFPLLAASLLFGSFSLLSGRVGAVAVNWQDLTQNWDPGDSSLVLLLPPLWVLHMEICGFIPSFLV